MRVSLAKYTSVFFSVGTWLATGVEPPRSGALVLARTGRAPSLRRLPDLRTSYGGEQEWRTAPWTQPSGLGWSRFQLRSGGKITRRFQYAGESEQEGAQPSTSGVKKKNKWKEKQPGKEKHGGGRLSSEAVIQTESAAKVSCCLFTRTMSQWAQPHSAAALFNNCF